MIACSGQGRGTARELGAEGDEPGPSSTLLSARSALADRPIDPSRAATHTDELLRAVLLPWSLGTARLGAHRLSASAKTRVWDGDRALESLDESVSLERTSTGDYHAAYENSQDLGREIFFVGNELWIRPRYGKYHRRSPTSPEEKARIADEVAGTLAAHVELVGPWIQVTDGLATQSAGRPARRVVLSRRDTAGAQRSRSPEKAWRESIVVETLDGEVALDTGTGAMLSGRLRARLRFLQKGRTLIMTLESKHELTELGGTLSVAAPTSLETVDTPQRSEEYEDRAELLFGIAPPARKAPTPQESRP